MPKRDETPTGAELDRLAEITEADVMRAKRKATQRVPQATRALDATRDDTTRRPDVGDEGGAVSGS